MPAHPSRHGFAKTSAVTLAAALSIVGLAACGTGSDQQTATNPTRAAAWGGDWKKASLPVTLPRGTWWAVCSLVGFGNGVTLDGWHRVPGARHRLRQYWTPRCSGGGYTIVKPETFPGTQEVELSGGGDYPVKFVNFEPHTQPWLDPRDE